MDKIKIVIYNHPNPEIKSFLSAVEIFPPRVESFKKSDNKEPADQLSWFDTVAARAVKELLEVPGVTEIRTKPKEVRMKKEEGSPWEPIVKEVVNILERALRKKNIRVL